MIRLDERTVELTQHEKNFKMKFEACLDDGYSIQQAIDLLTISSPQSEDFLAWLAE